MHDWRAARDHVDSLKEQLKIANERLTKAEREVIQFFRENNWKTGPVMSDGTRLTLVVSEDISVNKENSSAVAAWLDKTYGDHKKYSVPKLDKYAIRRQVLEDIENEVLSPHELPQALNYTTRPSIRCEGLEKARQSGGVDAR